MTRVRWCVLLGVLLLAGYQPAEAQRGACRGDVQQFCANVPRERQQIVQCLVAHRTQVSEGCRQAMMAARAKKQAGEAPAPPQQ